MPTAAREEREPLDREADREGAAGRPGSQETYLRPKPAEPSRKGVGSMTSARTILLGLLAVLLLALGGAQFASAETATVSVRVEGSSATLLPPTVVTTTGAPVVKDGNSEHACSGANAVGALDIATGGNWSGSWFPASEFGPGEYAVETILGESHLFTGPTYWEFWIDNAPSTQGVCSKQIHSGDTLLFFPSCFGAECPPPQSPLGIEAPADAAAGAKVPVTVTSYANGSGAPSPAPGATIAYEGKTAETDAAGHATLEFAHPGSQEVKVTKAESVRTETTVCVHAGEDGTCGSSTPRGGVSGFTSELLPYKGPFALVADVTSLRDGRTYGAGHAPRLIAGRISAHASVTSVSLALRRSYRGRCSSFDGKRGRFRPARCGVESFFAVSKEGAFSYLLPGSLPPGRYVLDVRASDVGGEHDGARAGDLAARLLCPLSVSSGVAACSPQPR